MIGDNSLIPRYVNPERISPYLHCVICQEVFTDPIRLNCGHTFCGKCIEHWFLSRYKCPTCRAKVIEFSKDLLAYDLVNDLEVKCHNEEKGCPWKGALSELNNHLKVCEESLKIILEEKKKKEEEEKKKKEEDDKKKKKSLKRKKPNSENQNGNESLYDVLKDYFANKEEIIISSDEVKKIKEVFNIKKDNKQNKEKREKIPLKNRQQNNN